MKLNKKWRFWLAQLLLGGAIVIALILVRGIRAGDEPVHLTTDWSDRYVIFSSPKSLLQSLNLARDPRYVRQWVRRYAERRIDWRWRGGHNTEEDLLHGDWSVYIGSGGTVGAGNYPAKYTFNVGTASCAGTAQPDFVVYNTSLAGSAAAVAAFDTGTFSAAAASGSTITITNPNTSRQLVLTPGVANANTGTGTGTFIAGGSPTASATGLSASIQTAGNGSYIGVSATSAVGVVTITAASTGTTGNSITVTASTSPTSNFNLTFANLVNGASGVPTIVAFDNLYSLGCTTGPVPSVYWAYNTGTTESVVTSPTLSADGRQVAFIQSVAAGVANLVLLRWAAIPPSTVASPATPTTAPSPTAYYNGGTGCTAPCMVTIAFGNGASDTQSSPFYDYTPGSDTLYVGDSTGYIHKFTPVFNGVPAEVTVTWPFKMASAPLSSPVYDPASGNVFANASYSTTNNGGRLHSLCATGTACGTVGVTNVASGILGPSKTGGTCAGGAGTSGDGANLFVDAPILDSTNEVIYDVIGNDGTGKSALFQFPAGSGFLGGSCGTEITLGTGTTSITAGVPVYTGNFDNLYYTGSAGNFYVCGNTGGDPTLYQIAVPATGVLTAGAATPGPVLTTAATTCGPVVEVYNPNTGSATKDWIFTSVQASGQTASPISCPPNTGCIMSFDVTNGTAISASTLTVGTKAVPGGASGIVIDNTVGSGTLAGASQVYFTPLATGSCTTPTGPGIGGCAVQASQSALQ